MAVSWSPLETCYRWDCLFGCQGSDYESEWDAQLAEARHDCGFVSFPEES